MPKYVAIDYNGSFADIVHTRAYKDPKRPRYQGAQTPAKWPATARTVQSVHVP